MLKYKNKDKINNSKNMTEVPSFVPKDESDKSGLDRPKTDEKTQLRAVKDDEKGMGSNEYLFRKLLAKKTLFPEQLSREEEDSLARLSEMYEEGQAEKGREEIPEALEIEAGSFSMESTKHANQDNYAVDKKRGLACIADGLGGEGGEFGGGVASLVTSRIINKALETRMAQGVVLDSDDKASKFMLDAIRSANRAVIDLQDPDKYKNALELLKNMDVLDDNELSLLEQQGVESLKDMKTTASAMVFYKDKSGELKAVIGHVGDSRIYKMGDNGLEQITTDHDPIADALAEGLIDKEDASNLDRSIAECPKLFDKLNNPGVRAFFKNKFGRDLESVTLEGLSKIGVSKSIGIKGVEPDVFTINVESGQLFLLCTDGLNKNYSDSKIEEEMKSDKSPQDKARRLSQLARGKAVSNKETYYDDDITNLVIEAPLEELQEEDQIAA